MAARDLLDHDLLAPFAHRMGRSRFRRAAENIAFGHGDFADTLKQWTNSSSHRANPLQLLHGPKGKLDPASRFNEAEAIASKADLMNSLNYQLQAILRNWRRRASDKG
jgi:hypothetical protein